MKTIARTTINPTNIQIRFRDGSSKRIRLNRKLCQWVVNGCEGEPQGLPAKLSNSLERQLLKEIYEKRDRKSWASYLEYEQARKEARKMRNAEKRRERTRAIREERKRKELERQRDQRAKEAIRKDLETAKRKEELRQRESERLKEFRRRGQEAMRNWRSAVERWCEAHDVGPSHPDWQHYHTFKQNAAMIYAREIGAYNVKPSASRLRHHFSDRYPIQRKS